MPGHRCPRSRAAAGAARLFPRLAVLALAAVLAGPVPRAVGDDPDGPIDLAVARAAFDDAKRLSDADGGALWGHEMDGPIMFVDPATRTVVANHRDRSGKLHRVGDDLFTGRLPETIGLANTATRWEGEVWSMVLWPLPADPSWRGALLMHECFHRLQPVLGLPLSVPHNHHLDSAGGRVWIRLEWRALDEAFDAPDPLASDALGDALVFRAYRRSLFSKAAREERELELNEGLAEYTGVRLSGADAETQVRRARESLRRYDRIEAPLVRSLGYASGAAYGLLLDRAKPGWPRRMRRSVDYGTLLARAIRHRRPKDLALAAREAAGLYDIDALEREEAEREVERQRRVAEMRERYVEGPVLTLSLDGSHNYSFNSHEVHALEGVGSVYRDLHLSASWGILDAPGGALMVLDPRGSSRVVVPAPIELPLDGVVRGDGWTLRLDAAYRLGPARRGGDVVLRRRRE